MYRYYNANPLGRKVNDCTIRAIALATGESWDSTYNYLSDYAQQEAVMMDNVMYIDKFLDKNFAHFNVFIWVFLYNCKVFRTSYYK